MPSYKFWMALLTKKLLDFGIKIHYKRLMMKLTLETDNGEVFEAEGYSVALMLEDILYEAEMIEDGDSVEILSSTQRYVANKC